MIVGLMLAGGAGMRLGGVDKPLLALGDRSIAERVLARLSPQVSHVAISANGDPARYESFGVPILADERAGCGPLGGVLRGLGWAADLGAAWLLSVPGDTPFIPGDLATRLSPGPSWAANAAGLHPLAALWPVACKTELASWLAGQIARSVQTFGETLGMRAVQFGDTPDPFANINTPADLAAARARV